MDENSVRIKNLEREIAELEHQLQLERAEVIRLRRWIERLEERHE